MYGDEEYEYERSIRNDRHQLRQKVAALEVRVAELTAELGRVYDENDRLRRQCGDHLAALAVGEGVRVGTDR